MSNNGIFFEKTFFSKNNIILEITFFAGWHSSRKNNVLFEAMFFPRGIFFGLIFFSGWRSSFFLKYILSRDCTLLLLVFFESPFLPLSINNPELFYPSTSPLNGEVDKQGPCSAPTSESGHTMALPGVIPSGQMSSLRTTGESHDNV